jgi:hypothetical protein
MTAQHTPEKTLMQGANETLDLITSPSTVYGSDFVEISGHIDSRVFGDIKRAVNSHEPMKAALKLVQEAQRVGDYAAAFAAVDAALKLAEAE